MFLAIDVGNTQTTLGLFDEDGTVAHGWRMATSHTDTSDMIDARLHGYFNKDGLDQARVTAAGIACVVPVLTRAWYKCLLDRTGTEPLVVTPQTDSGMRIDMPDPTQVGADRIANAVAARLAYGAPVIVVDFGTATNIDVVDAAGSYRGGAISPGLMLSAAALFSRGQALQRAHRGSRPRTGRDNRGRRAIGHSRWRGRASRRPGCPHQARAGHTKCARGGNRWPCTHRERRNRPFLGRRP